LLISKAFQNYKSPSNVSLMVSSTPTHDHYAAAFPSSLRSPRVPIFSYTNELVIIAKRKNHTRTQTQARG